jgi:hypothetical protein
MGEPVEGFHRESPGKTSTKEPETQPVKQVRFSNTVQYQDYTDNHTPSLPLDIEPLMETAYKVDPSMESIIDALS